LGDEFVAVLIDGGAIGAAYHADARRPPGGGHGEDDRDD
jgi:hypothetical protein